MSKPPFRIPTMADIAKIRDNGLRVVSTFSGCGGSCLGFKMAGYRVLWANEFAPMARATYVVNHEGAFCDPRNIRSIVPEEILEEIEMKVGELDVLEGSPPCSSFSVSGDREKGWGKVKTYRRQFQRTDDLFFEYIRILRGLRPRSFVAENVLGLVIGTAKQYFNAILREMRASGYRVEVRAIEAQWLGVPQIRPRVFFVGVREDLGREPAFPQPLPYRYSVAEVLPHVERFHIPGRDRHGVPRPWRLATAGCFPTITEQTQRMSKKAWFATNGMVQLKDGTRRKLTIEELKKITTLPADFELLGNDSQRWERCGRAVPPMAMYHIASTLRDRVLL